MCLFTSIKPPADAVELAYLLDCLKSWKANDFDIIAVNGPSECDALQTLDLPISLYRLARDGKPRIIQLLTAIKCCRHVRYAGIINSDCRMVRYPELAANLQATLDGSCAVAWRVDVGPNMKPSATSHGFDAFFFDTRFIPDDDCGFSIGDPWWDYWFPLACETQGARLETLAIPLLTHKVHPLNWKRRNWEGGALRFWTALRNWRPKATVARSIFTKIPDTWWQHERLTASQVAKLSLIAPTWFHKERPQAITVLPRDMAEVEMMLCMTAQALLDAAEYTLARNVLTRVILPLRIVVGVFRRVRQVLFGRLQFDTPRA
jgi:hypothetical protein